MVKVWKQGCAAHAWCMGYERRTAYYIAYRQVYRQEYQTVYKCCSGWTQLNDEVGCLYRKCLQFLISHSLCRPHKRALFLRMETFLDVEASYVISIEQSECWNV
ncbi:hypothetical protein ACEWY4_000180 [Coilia grayii]|uniref:EMI domain-containing protein n=1 Tax=Coilia grayii TaxID=363190 RepID=A0ABD1KVX6_9TELE